MPSSLTAANVTTLEGMADLSARGYEVESAATEEARRGYEADERLSKVD